VLRLGLLTAAAVPWVAAVAAGRAEASPGVPAMPAETPDATARTASAGLVPPGRSPRLPALGGPTHGWFAGMAYVTRHGWGADESLRFDAMGAPRGVLAYFPVQALVVHHTALPVGGGAAAAVRAVYRLHTVTHQWADIGYHFLIGPDGGIYEGRWSGEDGVPAHDGSGRAVRGAHVLNFNPGTMGVALLGDLTAAPATPVALRSLARLLAALACRHHLDPRRTVHYRNPTTGRHRVVNPVSGHRDWLTTECPGAAMAPLLPALRRDVADRIGLSWPDG
jgi:hypothetical protein